MKIKSSPYYIISFTRKYSLFLLTLPLQPLVVTKSQPHSNLFLYIFNILITATILFCSFISYLNIQLFVTTSRFILKKGVLIKQTLTLPKKDFHNICVSQNPLQRLLKVCKVTFASGTGKGEVFLSIKNLENLPQFAFQTKKKKNSAIKTSFTDILIMCAGFSPALTATLTLIPFIRNLSKFLPLQYISSANLWEIFGYHRLPPILGFVSSLILTGWFAGFSISALRFWKLTLITEQNFLQTKSGFFSKKQTLFSKEAVRAVVLRSSLFMFFLNRYRLDFLLTSDKKTFRVTAGCNKKASYLYMFPPIPDISPFSHSNQKIKPVSTALLSYTVFPLLSLATLSAFSIFIRVFSKYKIEPHLGVFLCLWCIVWFFHRTIGFYHSSICVSQKNIWLQTISGLSFINVFILTQNIRCVRITQNVFQKRKGTCNLRIYIRCNHKKSFLLRHINIKKAAELKNKLCG